MNRRRVSTAAIVSTIVIAALTFFAFHRHAPGVHRVTYHGLFRSAQGIIPGAPVREAGVDVGVVTAVRAGAGDSADIAFTLHAGTPIYTDARLRLRPRLFLEGGFYVQLSPGGFAGGPLHDGGRIPAAQTSISVQSDQVLATFASRSRQSGATILRELARAMRHGGAEDLRAVSRSLPHALLTGAIAGDASLGTAPGDLSAIIRSSASVARTLAIQQAGLVDAVEGGATTNAVFARHAGDLRSLLREARRLLRITPPALDAIDASLPPTDRAFRAALPALPQLPGTLRNTAALLDQLGALTRPAALPRLIRTAAPTIKRLPRLTTRTQALLRRVNAVSTCTTRRILPVLDAKLDDGKLSTGRPVWQDLLHSTTLLAGTAQNFDGNGPWSRFQGGASNYIVSTGSLPGTGTLVGFTTLPLLGTRPQWNGITPPPYHPEASCTAQPATSLAAPVGAVEGSTRYRGRG